MNNYTKDVFTKCATGELGVLKEILNSNSFSLSFWQDVVQLFIDCKNKQSAQWWDGVNNILEHLLYSYDFNDVKDVVGIIFRHESIFIDLAPVLYRFSLKQLLSELTVQIKTKEFKRLFQYAADNACSAEIKKMHNFNLIDFDHKGTVGLHLESSAFVCHKCESLNYPNASSELH